MTAFALASWIATTSASVAPVLTHADASGAARHHQSGPATRPGRHHQAANASVAPLVFGIYPGGAAGVVGPSGPVKPEDPAKRLATLERLRPPGRPFVVRLYAAYNGPGTASAEDQLGQQLTGYTNAGLDFELVLTYRPRDGGSGTAVAGFAAYVRNTVRALGSNPRFISLQVTNEANVGGVPNVADGAYAGAKDALIRGVIAAKQEIRRDRFNQVKVGFNSAYLGGAGDREFWSYLGVHGGSTFGKALDWVGVDVYPGTWGPALHTRKLQFGTTAFVTSALDILESTWLPLARLSRTTALHISENGYPTGPGRTQAMQVTSMKAAITAVVAARKKYNVTSYCWFDLRDADSSSSSFQSQYGLLRDDYSPKPAFAVYRTLIAERSAR